MRDHQNFVIAIDGPAASGKGTLSRELAKALNFAHMDTGALYRAVAYEVAESGGDPENEAQALRGCTALEEKLKGGMGALENPGLRNDEIAKGASKVAALQAVRDRLVDIQRTFAHAPGDRYAGAVLDGRDIGTVICPDAPLKLFVTASAEVRAKRRLKELQSKGIEATYRAVLVDMRARDERDSSRKAAPLRPAADAIVLDTSDLSAQKALGKALEIVRETREKWLAAKRM
jgi:cytidylate kinase